VKAFGAFDGVKTWPVPDPQAVSDDFASRSPLARVAEPEEIAAAYVFLMASPNTTGTILTSDAGTELA
jgi:NAD(P)-dependent dehydrogenase (short-subunit alcohol dehydrogenase family)